MLDIASTFPSAKPSGDGHMAKCPAHEDRTASLSINTGDDGRVLLKCHAGCDVDAILHAAHLERRDLFPSNGLVGETNGKSQIEHVYDYQTSGGELLFQVVRFKPKDFRQRRPDGNGGYIWNVQGVDRVVYRLPEIQGKEAVFVTEGEKDADRLLSIGLTATTCSGGAEKWRDQYSGQLRDVGVKRVAIIPDNDDPGRTHADQVATSCQRSGLEVRILTLPDIPEKGDVSDYLDTHSKDDLIALAKNATLAQVVSSDHLRADAVASEHLLGPDEAHARRVENFVERERARREARRRVDAEERRHVESPAPVRLRDLLREPDEHASWRIDGWQPAETRVILPAQFKAGKTTLVGNLIRSFVDGDPFLGEYHVHPIAGTLALIDFEMSRRQLKGWLRSQQIRHAERVVVFSMRGRAGGFDIRDRDARAEWVSRLKAHGSTFLIIDCLRPILDALGMDENHECGQFLVALDMLLEEAGIRECLIVHHMGHTGERSRGDSRLRDWPDVEWRLVRQDDDPSGPRYISAYGRDVDIPEQRLAFNPETRGLTLDGGSRRDESFSDALEAVEGVLGASDEPLSGRKVEAELRDEYPRGEVRGALKLGIRRGKIAASAGLRNAVLHTLMTSAPQCAASAPGAVRVSAPVLIRTGAHSLHGVEGKSDSARGALTADGQPFTFDPTSAFASPEDGG